MTIGRTDDPKNPISVTASRSRRTVWDWIADPIWASGHGPRQQAGHMNAVDHPVRSLANALEPEGSSTHDSKIGRRYCTFAVPGLVPVSRVAPELGFSRSRSGGGGG